MIVEAGVPTLRAVVKGHADHLNSPFGVLTGLHVDDLSLAKIERRTRGAG